MNVVNGARWKEVSLFLVKQAFTNLIVEILLKLEYSTGTRSWIPVSECFYLSNVALGGVMFLQMDVCMGDMTST